MARYRQGLLHFLAQHGKNTSAPDGGGTEDGHYVLPLDYCQPFLVDVQIKIFRHALYDGDVGMKSAHMENIAGAAGAGTAPPEPMHIPARLVESLSEKQCQLLLHSLETLQKDQAEGKRLKSALEGLFGDTANVMVASNSHGERVWNITGKNTALDNRRYMERYAEHVASHTLFDVAKALNTRLEEFVPPAARERFFEEGRDFSDRKIRYGETVSTELVLSDEGAWVYTNIVDKSAHLHDAIVKLMRQSMLDPFGLSLKHYMGKHNVLKAGKRPLVKLPPVSGFWGWLKGLFHRSDPQ